MFKSIQRFINRTTLMGLLILALVGTTASTVYISQNFEIAKNLDIFATLFRELVVNYVDEVNPSELMKTGIDEMLSSLDPYTNFIPESEIEDYRFMTTGQYGGIGSLIVKRGEYIYISEPYEGFPAQRAGLLPGDKILKINGESAKSRSSEEVSSLLKGQPGTEVFLLIEREGEAKPLQKALKREVVRINNIPYYGMLNDKTGYIKLTGFTQNAGREVRDAFQSLKADHNLESIVLDLRGNGGGLLNEAVNVANLFIDKNKLVVSTRGKIAERNTSHHTLNNPIDKEIPLVVLVDRGSASASEIVAGAIQDFDRGIIIGNRTFGKGLVQNVVPLSYNTQLKVTVAKYYIPSGRCIQAIDYAQKNEDGSVAAIPDSLKTPFKTAKGRTVYDGGGIEPDINLAPPTLSNISIALLTRFHIFDFANKFARETPSITQPENFEITDAVYTEFIRFLEGKDYDYTTESEMYLQRLMAAAQKDKYFQAIEAEYRQLKDKIMHNKEEDLLTFRPEIESFLREEIAARYFHQQGRVRASLREDTAIAKALEVLNNTAQYHKMLSAQ